MSRDEKQDAKERLLSAGLKLFAERGFDGSTFRDICDAADTNIASINYHFKDKDTFYLAVREYAWSLHRKMMVRFWEMVPQDPWAALRIHIEILLEAEFDEQMNLVSWFRMRELMDYERLPIHSESGTKECRHRQYAEKMTTFLSALLGSAATSENISLLRYTYHSLCQFMPIHRQIEDRMLHGRGAFNLAPLLTKEQLADFIFQTVKRTVENMQAAQPK